MVPHIDLPSTQTASSQETFSNFSLSFEYRSERTLRFSVLYQTEKLLPDGEDDERLREAVNKDITETLDCASWPDSWDVWDPGREGYGTW